jgi:hypothetical protein
MKGALVGIDPFNPLASVIAFQYNPESLTRELQAQTTMENDTKRCASKARPSRPSI